MSAIRLLIADDHGIILDGFSAIVRDIEDMEVVATASDGRSAVRLAKSEKPDVVILDICMPELNGIDAARQIKLDMPGIKIISLSMHTRRKYVDGMLKAGASGYILKSCAFEEIEWAIRAVMAGKVYISPEVARTMVTSYVAFLEDETCKDADALSDREREVLQGVSEGQTTKVIADNLNLSPKTIEAHRRHLMDKLRLFSVAELTKYAIREGITSL